MVVAQDGRGTAYHTASDISYISPYIPVSHPYSSG